MKKNEDITLQQMHTADKLKEISRDTTLQLVNDVSKLFDDEDLRMTLSALMVCVGLCSSSIIESYSKRLNFTKEETIEIFLKMLRENLA